ncbi:MAG: serine hydrolase domain-containing protein [Dehalococcoidia bacterium]
MSTPTSSQSIADSAVNSAVQSLIERQVAEGRQVGVQVCAYRDGEPVVDAWAGTMGPADSRPIQPDSLVLSFSVTKGVTGLAVHILAEKGLIDYDAPVSKYWPGFTGYGKEKLSVAQALTHQGGLHAMPSGPFQKAWITDWDAAVKRLEEQVPAYEPGTATGYHAVTHGWIAGQIVQGASGRHIKDVIREEIAEPLGMADSMFVGIPDGLEDRLTTLEIAVLGEGAPLPEDADMFKAMPKDQWQYFNDMDIRKACLPSGNGHFTARALAKMYSALATDGSVDGVRLVRPDRIQHMNRLVTDDIDRVLLSPVRKAIGFFLGGETNGVVGAMGRRQTAFGHPGAGGSNAFCDPEAGLSVAILMNKMAFGAPGTVGVGEEIANLIRKELGVE